MTLESGVRTPDEWLIVLVGETFEKSNPLRYREKRREIVDHIVRSIKSDTVLLDTNKRESRWQSKPDSKRLRQKAK